MSPSDQSKFSYKNGISSGRKYPVQPPRSLAEAADRVRDELSWGSFPANIRPDDKEAVAWGNARNWARPRRQAAAAGATKFTFLQPSTLESSAAKTRRGTEQ